jgi:hypothetical protein
MTTPVRYPNGINDHASGNAGMGRFYPQPDPTRYVRWFDDFHGYTSGDWVVTETQAGATQAAAAAGHGGILSLVNTSTDNDVNSLQWAGGSGATVESFKFTATKKFWIRARFKVSNATESDVIIGLAITDTSPLQSLPSDYIAFYKADGATTLVAAAAKNSTASTITMGSMVDDTYVTAEMYFDGKSTLTAMLDGVPVGTDITSTTNIVDDEELAVTIAVQAGDANARTLSVDFLEILFER